MWRYDNLVFAVFYVRCHCHRYKCVYKCVALPVPDPYPWNCYPYPYPRVRVRVTRGYGYTRTALIAHCDVWSPLQQWCATALPMSLFLPSSCLVRATHCCNVQKTQISTYPNICSLPSERNPSCTESHICQHLGRRSRTHSCHRMLNNRTSNNISQST